MQTLCAYLFLGSYLYCCLADEDINHKIRTLEVDLFFNNREQHLLKTPSYNLTTGSIVHDLFKIVGPYSERYRIFAPIVIRNFLKWPLTGGQGKTFQDIYGGRHRDTPIPIDIMPGTMEAFLALQASNSRGISQTTQWSLRMYSKSIFVRFMWSIPYSPDFYGFFVGCELETLDRPMDDSWNDMYYNKEKHMAAGEKHLFQHLDDIVVFAYMTVPLYLGVLTNPRVILTIASTNPDHMFDFFPVATADNVFEAAECPPNARGGDSNEVSNNYSENSFLNSPLINSYDSVWDMIDYYTVICSVGAFVIGGITAATIFLIYMRCKCGFGRVVVQHQVPTVAKEQATLHSLFNV